MQLQRRLGGLTATAEDRLPHFMEMLEWLSVAGVSPVGATCVEVGTGHKATLPLMYALAGAETVHTVDLNRRLQMDLMGQMIGWAVDNGEDLVSRLGRHVPEEVVRERLGILAASRSDPAAALAAVGVNYVAPGDAASLSLGEASVDIHFSMTVLEHIPAEVLRDILAEANRVLTPNGVALHFVDLSDHFAHGNPSISRANFLRFAPAHWERLAGNEFGYCNRMRSEEYRPIFTGAGLVVDRWETGVDQRSLGEITSGELPVDPCFGEFDHLELATDYLAVMARGGG